MKTFKTFLQESKKTYAFKLYFSGKPPEKLRELIQRQLAPFEPSQVSDVKTQPIAHSHELFPGEKNPDIHVVDVVMDYPVTTHQIHQLLAHTLPAETQLVVINTQHDQTLAQQQARQAASDQALLTQDYAQEKTPETELTDPDYNQKLVKNALTGKSVPPELKKQTNQASTTNDLPQGKLSAMGSVKTKLPPRPETGRK